MARPDFSEATEDEVKDLFNEDGPLEDPVADDESSEETEVEAAEEDEEAEPAEDQEETKDESEEEEAEVANWEEAPEAYAKEYREAKEAAERWQKAHSKLQSELTRRSQAQREEERSLPAIRQKAQYADEWNSLLEKNPRLQQMIEREVAAMRNPASAIQVPKELEGDPAVQFMQNAFAQVLQPLQARLAQAEAAAGKVQSWENKNQEAHNEEKLNGLLAKAGDKIKTMFGRDATQEEITQVLQYMVDNQYFQNGAVVAMEVFGDQYEKQLAARNAAKMKEKSKKFPSRSKGVNPSRVGKSRDALTPEEAISMALADQGFGA